MPKRCLILIPVLLLTACGFHLRGSQTATAVNISSIYLQSEGAEIIMAEIRKQFLQTETSISDNAADAEYTIDLSNQRTQKSVMSVSATTGKVEKYKLLLSVSLSIAKGETPLISNETISVTRDYTFDTEAVLGKYSEEQLLQEEMVRSAASQIIRRLNALARK